MTPDRNTSFTEGVRSAMALSVSCRYAAVLIVLFSPGFGVAHGELRDESGQLQPDAMAMGGPGGEAGTWHAARPPARPLTRPRREEDPLAHRPTSLAPAREGASGETVRFPRFLSSVSAAT